jgi:hypothetical protein
VFLGGPLVLGYGKQMCDESWGTGPSTLAKRPIIDLGQNYNRRPASPCDVLRLSLQCRLNDLAELSFCIMQPPLRTLHANLLDQFKLNWSDYLVY